MQLDFHQKSECLEGFNIAKIVPKKMTLAHQLSNYIMRENTLAHHISLYLTMDLYLLITHLCIADLFNESCIINL